MSLIQKTWKTFFWAIFIAYTFCSPAFSQSPILPEDEGRWAEELVKRLKEEREQAKQNLTPEETQDLWRWVDGTEKDQNLEDENQRIKERQIVIGVSATGAGISSLLSTTIEPRDLPPMFSRNFSPIGLNLSIIATGTVVSCALAISGLKIIRKASKKH